MSEITWSRSVAWTQECKSCQGTGLYVGLGERDGAAVVCKTCQGTGEQTMRFEYRAFEGRRLRKDVTQVYATGSGIVLSPQVTPGGVPYEQWQQHPESVDARGTELREQTCPAWWHQNHQRELQPDWDECKPVLSFPKCPLFPDKAGCWEQFDREQAKSQPA